MAQLGSQFFPSVLPPNYFGASPSRTIEEARAIHDAARGKGSASTGPALPSKVFSPVEADPGFATRVEDVIASINRPQASFEDLLSQGINSPLLQAILGPALRNLLPGAEEARQSLTDRFRASGGLRSGAYGVRAGQLESDILGQQGDLISRVISSFLPTAVSGLQNESARSLQQSSLLESILGLTKPQFIGEPVSTRLSQPVISGASSSGPIPFITPSMVGNSAPAPQSAGSDLLQQLLSMQLPSPSSTGGLNDFIGSDFDSDFDNPLFY